MLFCHNIFVYRQLVIFITDGSMILFKMNHFLCHIMLIYLLICTNTIPDFIPDFAGQGREGIACASSGKCEILER